MSKLGRTGDFPRGKLNADDEGGLRCAIGVEDGVVKVYFGTPVAWLGMPRRYALAFAESIRKHAETLADDH